MTPFSSFPFSAALLRTLLAVCLLALRLPAAAQAPTWQSARAVATATAASNFNGSELRATAVDAAGNVYLTGTFRNTVLLGSIALTSEGATDIFVQNSAQPPTSLCGRNGPAARASTARKRWP